MATTPVSDAYIVPTVSSIAVGSNLITDYQENTSATLSANYFSPVQSALATVVASSIQVSTNLITDYQENQSSTISTNYSSPVQTIVTAGAMGSINVASTPMSATPTASEQLTKVQIWTIS